jgi:glutamate formiminotransferase
MPRLECVPNVSEGRRPAVFRRLVDAVRGEPGALLLDASRDADHNRSVLTLAGDAEPLEGALLALFETALATIDLRRHRGVHPRLGAVDVVPFVPLGDTPMAEAVAAARCLGREVADRFGLPVFLYEEAAPPGRPRRLPDLRRGGLDGLAARLGEPGWEPDFGPSRVHPAAGVAVVGARTFLIAANAVLDTADLAVARAVARAVRESSGGLPAVRALGLPLASRGLAQVSMNLLDHRRTGPVSAFAAVAREAAAAGARVLERELVGLVPAAALEGEGAEAEELRREWGGRTVEERLAAALGARAG